MPTPSIRFSSWVFVRSLVVASCGGDPARRGRHTLNDGDRDDRADAGYLSTAGVLSLALRRDGVGSRTRGA